MFLKKNLSDTLHRCILGELFTKKPIFQANQELAQLELIRYKKCSILRTKISIGYVVNFER